MSEPAPLVGVIMGSDSDFGVMSDAVQVLREFGIPHEVAVVSAHRTPEKMVDYARSAAGRGLKAIIAGAGGAAHLPGMVASMTTLPVIGVPVPLAKLDGLDSLLSIVQMPGGIPVVTLVEQLVVLRVNMAHMRYRCDPHRDRWRQFAHLAGQGCLTDRLDVGVGRDWQERCQRLRDGALPPGAGRHPFAASGNESIEAK